MNNPINITIITVVYNNYEDTLNFCNSVRDQRYKLINHLNVLIVDNSTEGLISELISTLENEFNFVVVMRPNANLGYFGGFNYALKNIEPLLSKFIVICNNDIVFNADFFDNLSRSDYDHKFFAICPDIITSDGYHQNPHVLKPLGFFSRLKLDLYFSNYYVALFLKYIHGVLIKFYKSRNMNDYLNPTILHMGIGACYVLSSSFFSKFKSLDYPFFLYGEEAYLANQIHKSGGFLYYDPSLIVYHKESSTLSKLPGKVTYNFAREGYCSYRKFY